jgi:polyisoprenoid-binding protein YceI
LIGRCIHRYIKIIIRHCGLSCSKKYSLKTNFLNLYLVKFEEFFMSRLKTFVLSPTRVNYFRRTVAVLGVGLAMISLAAPANAACTYTIESQWDTGFSAKIKITNTTGSNISSWAVVWQYAGANRVASAYNVTLTGTNPYTANNLSWNGSIAVGAIAEFGFQGTKTAGTSAEIPAVTGSACAGAGASSTPASSKASVAASSKASTPASSKASVTASSTPASSKASVAASSIPVSSKASVAASSAPASSKASIAASSSSAVGVGVLFQDGFEGGAVNTQPAGWSNLLAYNLNGSNVVTGSTYALIDSSKSYTGSNSIHFKGSMTQILRSLPTGLTRLHIRAYVNMAKQLGSEPADNHEHIMGVKATQDANNEIRVGQIKGVLGTNEVPSDNIAPKMDQWGKGPIISANAWHCVETAMYADTTYDELRMWVDGALVHSITSGADWNNGALAANWMDGKFNYVEFGFQSFSGNTTDVWMDDIVVSTQPIGCGAVVPSSSKPSSSTPSSIAASSKSSVVGSSARSSAIANSSVPSSTAQSSKVGSSISNASSSNTSVGSGFGNWQLNTTDSYLNFVTTKNLHTIEVQKFDVLSGSMTDAGVATFAIDLTSVNTANTVRDQRLRDLFFETGVYPAATVKTTLNSSLLSSIAVGKTAVVDISASLSLHGVTGAITTKVLVQKLSSSRVMVQSIAPIIVKSSDYALEAGVEALRAAVGISSVSGTVPVDFVLVFNAQ